MNNVITGQGEEEGRRAEPYISHEINFYLFFSLLKQTIKFTASTTQTYITAAYIYVCV